MGGLWVDCELMSNILHWAFWERRIFLIMVQIDLVHPRHQGLVDGYFVISATLPNYLVDETPNSVNTEMPEFKEAEENVRARINKFVNINGNRSVDSFHRELGLLVWDKCGMSRTESGLKEALKKIPKIRDEFWSNLRVPGDSNNINQELEKAGRVADFIDFAELLVNDDSTEKLWWPF